MLIITLSGKYHIPSGRENVKFGHLYPGFKAKIVEFVHSFVLYSQLIQTVNDALATVSDVTPYLAQFSTILLE